MVFGGSIYDMSVISYQTPLSLEIGYENCKNIFYRRKMIIICFVNMFEFIAKSMMHYGLLVLYNIFTLEKLICALSFNNIVICIVFISKKK